MILLILLHTNIIFVLLDLFSYPLLSLLSGPLLLPLKSPWSAVTLVCLYHFVPHEPHITEPWLIESILNIAQIYIVLFCSMNLINQVHSSNFLWLAEHKLMYHFICLQNLGFVWDNLEHGHFCRDFFPLISMPIIEHKLWV